jgi:hypothetical protein
MILSVDFGAPETGIGYQFMDRAGNLLGTHSIDVSAGSQPGMFFIQVTPPGNATAIIWDCASGITARDDFQELAYLESSLGEEQISQIVVDASLVIPGSIGAEFDADLSEAIRTFEQSFFWNGRKISAGINYRLSRILTVKSYFGSSGNRVYPKCGQTIMIAGKKYQITRKGNAQIKPVAGGFIEDPAFIDDATNPSLEIEYAHFVTK